MTEKKTCKHASECNLDELGIVSGEAVAWAKKMPIQQLLALVRIDECAGKFPLPFKGNKNNAEYRTMFYGALLSHEFLKGINWRTVMLSELYYDLTGERISTEEVNRRYQEIPGVLTHKHFQEINHLYERGVWNFTDAQIHEVDQLLQFWIPTINEHAAVVLKAHYSRLNKEVVSAVHGIDPKLFGNTHKDIVCIAKELGIAREMARILLA